MSALKAYATHIASAMDILAEAHGMSERALLELGLPDVEARDLRTLAAVYFGPSGFSRKQRHAAAAARHHDLVTLKLIEKYVSRVRTQRDAWNLRVELCRLRGPASEIARRAKGVARGIIAVARIQQANLHVVRQRDRTRGTDPLHDDLGQGRHVAAVTAGRRRARRMKDEDDG